MGKLIALDENRRKPRLKTGRFGTRAVSLADYISERIKKCQQTKFDSPIAHLFETKTGEPAEPIENFLSGELPSDFPANFPFD